MQGTMSNAIPYNKPNIKTGNVERLKPYLEDKKLLKDLQFGFRPGRSTHTYYAKIYSSVP